MKKLIIILTAITAVSCTSSTAWKSGTMNRMHVHENDILKKFVITQPERFRQEMTLPAFKLAETEFLTMESDLNSDGKPDLIGSVDNFKFYDKGYPLYIILKTEYWHTKVKTDVKTDTFNIQVLETTSHGLRDLSVDGRTIRFNGEIYQ